MRNGDASETHVSFSRFRSPPRPPGTERHRRFGRRARCARFGALILASAFGTGGTASSGPDDAPPPTLLSAGQMDALVAPIALHPDIVLDSMLPATTDPLGIVAAARLLQESPGATAAPAGSTWDASVVAMLQFPDVLRWMSDNLPWLESMGYAMWSQPADVLAAIQRYRDRAVRSGALASDEHLRISLESPGPEEHAPAGTTYVVIAPTRPEIVYVPSYDPWPLLSATWVWTPGRSFLSFGVGFVLGSSGAWAWHDIVWSWGSHHHVRVCGQAWWWWKVRPPAWTWGPFRPLAWRPVSWSSRPWASRTWRPDLTVRARPSLPTWHSYATPQRRVVTVTPPSVRPGLPWVSARVGTAVSPLPTRSGTAPTVTWPVPGTATVPRATAPRILPRWDWRSVDRARPSGPTPTWHLSDRGRVTRQIDRGTRSLTREHPSLPPPRRGR